MLERKAGGKSSSHVILADNQHVTTPPALSPAAAHGRTVCFATAAFALSQAVQVNNGALASAAIAWITIALIMLTLAFRSDPVKLLTRVPLAPLLALFLAIQWIELFTWGIRWLSRSQGSIAWYVGGMVAAGIGVVAISRCAKAGVTLLVIGHFIAGAYVINAVQSPRIDVWDFQQHSSEALLKGEKPYSVRYRNLYHPDTSLYGDAMVTNGWLNCSCPYPPLSLILGATARAIGGDVRWSHLLALELAAVLMTLAAGRWGALAAAMVLLMPRALLVVEVAWTDAHVIMMLALVLYCARHKPKALWLAIGLLLASKQYTALMLPLVFLLTENRSQAVKLMLQALATAGAITLPFFLWEPTTFWQNVVLLQFQLPFRMDALSYTSWIAHLTGIQIGAGAGFIAATAAIIWTARRSNRTPAGFIAAAAFVMLAFFALNKQASCNYYFLVIACASFAAALTAQGALLNLNFAAQTTTSSPIPPTSLPARPAFFGQNTSASLP